MLEKFSPVPGATFPLCSPVHRGGHRLKVRWAAQHTQHQEIEAVSDAANPAKQQKMVKSLYYQASMHTGCYEPQWSEGAMLGSAHSPHLQSKSDNVQHSKQGLINHFDIPSVSGELIACYTDSAGSITTSEDADTRRCQTGDNPQLIGCNKLSQLAQPSMKAREPGIELI